MFRHADGNVLAEVLPVLDEAQFGPARAITFLAPDHPSARSGSALRRAVRPEDAAKATSGFLRLTSEQLESVEKARLERLHCRTVAYLKRVGQSRMNGRSDDKLSSE